MNGWPTRAANAAAAVAPQPSRALHEDLRERVWEALSDGDDYVDGWHANGGSGIIREAAAALYVPTETARWMYKATAHRMLITGTPLADVDVLSYTELAIAWDAGTRAVPLGHEQENP